MTNKSHKELRKRCSSDVLGSPELRALDAASSQAAVMIRKMIKTLSYTNANTDLIFKKLVSLRAATKGLDLTRKRLRES